MSQQVRVSRDIEFVGDAQHSPGNVKGPFSPEMVTLYDDFLGIGIDSTTKWAVSLQGTTPGTFKIVAAAGGIARFTMGTADNDVSEVASELTWSGIKKAIMEARIRVNIPTGCAIFVGFSDAKSETLLMAIDYNGGVLTTTATDAVGFLADADRLTSSIYCVGVKTDVDETPVDTGIDWVDAAWHILRVELNGDTATFYLDGTVIGYLDVSQNGAVQLCVVVHTQARAATSTSTPDIDYIKAWQER